MYIEDILISIFDFVSIKDAALLKLVNKNFYWILKKVFHFKYPFKNICTYDMKSFFNSKAMTEYFFNDVHIRINIMKKVKEYYGIMFCDDMLEKYNFLAIRYCLQDTIEKQNWWMKYYYKPETLNISYHMHNDKTYFQYIFKDNFDAVKCIFSTCELKYFYNSVDNRYILWVSKPVDSVYDYVTFNNFDIKDMSMLPAKKITECLVCNEEVQETLNITTKIICQTYVVIDTEKSICLKGCCKHLYLQIYKNIIN